MADLKAPSRIIPLIITMVTNDFLSTGGDGYASLAAAIKLEVTQIGEQKILES